MSVVIFIKSFIEAVGTLATNLSYYQPLTISLFSLMDFFTGLSAWALLCSFSCYRPLTTSPFCLIGSATGLV